MHAPRFSIESIVICDYHRAISRQCRVTFLWELFADDLVLMAETEDPVVKMLNEWKDNMENRGMRVNMNKTNVMISGERQKLMQNAA